MRIDFVDLKRQNKLYKKELMRAIEKIVDDATFIMGDPLDKFERGFALYCNKKFCVGLNSGTDALSLGLIAYGVKKGDEVITVPNSYFSTAMVISNLGAIPVFVDINKENYNIDPDSIEAKITKKTKAIVPVHLYGQSADMGPIVEIAKKYNLAIIEDCCQAHGTKYKDKIVPYTESGAFSFYPGKNLGCFGDGGAFVTDNKNIQEKIMLLRNDGSKIKYEHKVFGYKSRLDTLQATILSVKLKYLTNFIKRRRSLAEIYNKCLKDISQIKTPTEMSYAYHTYHIYAILCGRRDELKTFLEKEGISTIIHYPKPIHLQVPYLKLGSKSGNFPITEQFSQTTLSLPMFPELKEEEIIYIAEKVKRFYS